MAGVRYPALLRMGATGVSAGLAFLSTDVSTPDRFVVAISALLAFSSVVVAVFGIWLAVLFPGIVAGVAAGTPREKVPGYQSFNYLIWALYRAAFVLSALAFVALLISFSKVESRLFMLSQGFFFYLCFFSLVDCLAQTIGWGEQSVVEGLNEGHQKGAIKRIFRGRK